MPIHISRQSKILFIGDSITDVGRGSEPEGVGHGYVRLIRDFLAARDPANAPAIINTGISGNKVTDLARRWERDVLAHSPDVLSIKIGINDVWHGLAPEGNGVSIGDYIGTYRELLMLTQKRLPKCQLVLCEPSVIWPPAPAHGNEILQPYVKAVQDLARQFNAAAVVPLHHAFTAARRQRPDIVWAPDGVHPSTAGHMLIALTWLKATGIL
jgi:lysophospholipase L1-like esterase